MTSSALSEREHQTLTDEMPIRVLQCPLRSKAAVTLSNKFRNSWISRPRAAN